MLKRSRDLSAIKIREDRESDGGASARERR